MARICQRCSHHNEDHAKFCLSCGAMLEVSDEGGDSDPLIGKVLLGRYRPISVLGEGGMGKVYLAEQKMGTATRKVAIKTLHPELSNDPQLVARFHRESETVIELRHPNTIQFYDFGDLDGGTLIIVMEYIEGEALADVLQREGAFDLARAEKILIQVCGSLHEAHQRGIVHRDLKPENILLTNQGGQSDFVKVLDFGIAKRDDAEDPNAAKLTKQGMVLGTPPYMSPEQFSGQQLDARSDVYSLGIVVYEMLTGKLPFQAATPWEWATKHLTAQPTPLGAHAAGARVPPNQAQAVMRALAKNRDERPDGVQAFLKEFTGYQDTDSAWAMATSSGGGGHATGQQGVARAPAPTPEPMPQTGGFGPAATPPPGYGSAPGVQPGMYSQPGMQPGMYSQPGMQSQPGYGQHGHISAPGVSAPGYSPGYSTGQQPQASSGGGLGKLLVLGVFGLFIVAGGAVGVGLWVINGDDDPPTITNNDPATVTAGVVNTVVDPNNVPMVPTGPQTPPLVPIQQLPPVVTPPEVVVDPVVPPTEPDPPVERTTPTQPRGPSAADETEARRLVAGGLGAARRNDFAGAVASLQQAQRRVGRRSPITRELQGELSRRGSNQVGALLQQGRCPQAQALYRQLRGVGAGSPASSQFADWCRAS